MPIEPYPQDGFQPESDDAVVWRFMPFCRFEELMRTHELYFCRSDILDDKYEGLPTEEYVRSVCANMGPEYDIDDTIGNLVQDKEAYFISCWYLFNHETAKMWVTYGRNGVAICSRYRLLRTALNAMPDRAMLGLVRYSSEHVDFNILRFITTKRPEFADEREVRALVWKPEWAGSGRHIGPDNRCHRRPLTDPPPHVLPGLRRAVDLQALIDGIVVSPEADPEIREEIKQLLDMLGYVIPVQESSLTRYPHVITNVAEIIRFTKKPE
jgi:hypothetical protein